MACETPFRDDSEQRLLFKIASCIQSGGGVAGVASFNGRTGVVTLTAADIATALGCTPACEADTISQADGDARYVLKSGDSMTGALSINNGVLVANDPALELSQTWNNAATTFTGLYENITLTAASANSNLFNFQVNGSDRFNFTSGGTLRAIRQDASDAGVNFFLRKRGNAGDANGAVAADSTIGAISYSGWDGTAFATGSHIDGLAAEAWTNLAHGSRINFYTTPIGSTTEQISLRLDANGQARFLDGTAALPSLTFQSDTNTGISRIGADIMGLSAGGTTSLEVTIQGVSVPSGLAYQYNSVNVVRAQTALNNYFFGPSGNLTMTGASNTSIGVNAFTSNTTGTFNLAIGSQALQNNTTGIFNVALGGQALLSNISGNENMAIGTSALSSNISGMNNVAVGSSALAFSTTSGDNVAIGYQALLDVTTSTGDNVAIGYNTGRGITTGANNTILGANVTGLAAALSNNIILADGAGAIRLQIDSSGNTSLAGNLSLATAKTLSMASGANTRAGNATLVAGTVTVANTSVTANTIVMLTRKTSGGTLGTAITYTVIAATSFTINSDSALDTSTFSYLLIENP